MLKVVSGATVALGFLVVGALAQQAITTKTPADMKYAPIPFAPGAESVYLASDGAKAEMYTLRVKLAKDAKIPPHTHPDARMVTVLSGELFAGTGTTPDPNNGVLLQAGSFIMVPAGAVHWSWAKNGEAVYQETGVGPTATNLIKP